MLAEAAAETGKYWQRITIIIEENNNTLRIKY